MFKLSLLIVRYLLQANDEIHPLYSTSKTDIPCYTEPSTNYGWTNETLWKMPITLCKNPWPVYGLSIIIFSASGFPVIIKFQSATYNLRPAKNTCWLTVCTADFSSNRFWPKGPKVLVTKKFVLATKSKNLGASWPQGFSSKVEPCRYMYNCLIQ